MENLAMGRKREKDESTLSPAAFQIMLQRGHNLEARNDPGHERAKPNNRHGNNEQTTMVFVPVPLNAETNWSYEEDENLPSNRATGRRSNQVELGSSAFSANATAKLPCERPFDPKHSGQGNDVPFKYLMDRTVEMRIHPEIRFVAEEWSQWHTSSGCNRDFLDYPPLLQFSEKFSRNLEGWTFMKCVMCKCVCPPPPYSCGNGHLFCFSCTSVLKGSLCIVTVPTGVRAETALCGKLLEPLRNEEFEKLFPEPRAKYHCPFKTKGCQMPETLLPVTVVHHAQTRCPFRYAIKCVIDGCKEIRVGYLVDHIVDDHGGHQIDMNEYSNTKPLVIYYDSKKEEETWVPILFTDKKKEVLFPLVMKKTRNFVYFWLYNIFERDAEVEMFQGTILLRSNKAEDLLADGILHDSSESNEAVIKSGRVLKIKTGTFEKNYISTHQYKSSVRREEKDYMFFVLRVAIMKTKN